MGGQVFSASFSAIAVTAAQDVFEIVAPANSWVEIMELSLGQYSDAGDAAAELLSIIFLKGYTVSGSGGASVTPANYDSRSSVTYGGTVERNNTTVANTGTPVTLHSSSFNVAAGLVYWRPEGERIILDASERLVFRITAPADEITLNGTLTFKQLGGAFLT